MRVSRRQRYWVPILYLEDIDLSMKRVQEYIRGLDFQHFKWDYKTVDAVIRNFEIIGEASKNLPIELKEKYSNIPSSVGVGQRIELGNVYIDPKEFYNLKWDYR